MVPATVIKNNRMSISVKKILEKQSIEASAPCRIDAGGTWDIKSLALPLEPFHPTTVNIAINLRTTVRLYPFRGGRVKISSEGFSVTEDYPHDHVPYHSSFGLFFAAISYFGFHGLKVHIRSDSPVKSALGGSSTALAALIKALSKIADGVPHSKLKGHDILHLAYQLEDSVSSGKCGIQDQAAAVFGGVNQWLWHFGRRRVPYERKKLLDRKGRVALSERVIVAFSGKSHVSSRINRNWITDFLSGETLPGPTEMAYRPESAVVHTLQTNTDAAKAQIVKQSKLFPGERLWTTFDSCLG